jgi:signal transduction histidine kinase/pSer/pThr/pTyr-binding forkhead associated (FHA) protein
VARLIVIRGADEGKQFDLTQDRLSIGRESSNRIRLHDTEVSRRHAELVRTPDGGYRLIDVGSANGSFVNGRGVQDVLLQPGDQVQIGQTLLVYSAVRTERDPASATSLADRISLITRQDIDLQSAIVKSVNETEGSRILARPEKVESAWLRANLGILYEAIQAVSQIVDLGQLLERLMELVFRSIPADRGCMMVRKEGEGPRTEEKGPEPPTAFEPQAIRWRNPPGRDSQEKLPLSRTIMEHVLSEKAGVLVSDAARDARFQAVQSLVRSGVREVICVPMRGRHDTLGVLYLDCLTPSRELIASGLPGKFNEDHLSLAIALAHQAALAVEDTRFYQAMLQAERLAAVGQTIAALSHHIKNILQGLKSGGEIVTMGFDGDDLALVRQGWKIVEKNQSKVYDLVIDMLTYSKEREPAIADVNLNVLVGEVVELMAGQAQQRGIELTTDLAKNLPICPADAEALHRALLNIVGNALDAVEEGEAPCVAVATALEPDGEWVQIAVRDNGPGIPADKLADIFRPFVSTKGGRGTGLGLPVSRKILREHGGDIVVTSTPGQGSIFALRLPLKSPIVPDSNLTAEFQTLPPPEAN